MKRFFKAIYCAPQVSHGDFPARNTDKVFALVKEAGIDNVFGYYEDKMGMECLMTSLKNAEKNKISFYPRLKVFDEFLGIDGAVNYPSTSYGKLSSDKKSALHREFKSTLDACAEYSSFGGIYMGDERGYETFEGIGAAQRLFSSVYPDKLFMYNHLNYFVDDHLYFYGAVQIEGEQKRLDGDLADDANNRFRRYNKFIDGYLDRVTSRYISTDVYPFAPTWKNVPTSIHRCLYEMQSFFADLKERTGIKPLTHIQVGNWCDDSRYIGKNEIALHLGIAAAYNFDGFVFFPGCFPNDWLDAEEGQEGYGMDGVTGLINAHGEPTIYYDDTRELVAHFDVMGEQLMAVNWLGVSTIGNFVGGFDEASLNNVEWNECIYRGGLPENETHEYNGDIPIASTSSQLFIGAFDTNGIKKFIIVNNSIVTECKITLNIEEIRGYVYQAQFTEHILSTLALQPGESILLVTK